MIKLNPSGQQFDCMEGETILDAALRVDIMLPHACKDGSCGACKGKVVSGLVSLEDHSTDALTELEKTQGYTLFCRAHPKGDVEIESAVLDELRHIEVKTLPARVESIHKVSPDVAILTLRLPKTEAFEFLPGQYIDILLADGQKRSYSIASANAADKLLELHVRKVEGGVFSTRVHETLKEKDMLRFRGPLGTFFVRATQKPIIMVATGTGFAPIKGMLTRLLQQGLDRPICFYWGCRTPADLYALAEIEALAAQTDLLRFIPVLSRPLSEDNWQGCTGHVQDAILRDGANFAGCEAYACGSPAMIADVKKLLCSNGLAGEDFHADPFYSSYSA